MKSSFKRVTIQDFDADRPSHFTYFYFPQSESDHHPAEQQSEKAVCFSFAEEPHKTLKKSHHSPSN